MSIRTARVAEEIQKVLGERLVRGLRDPLPGFVTIRGVEVTSDFTHAKIFVSVFGSPEQKTGAIEGLNHQRGFLRSEVGKKIRLRNTPQLTFILDESAERAARVHALLDEVKAQDKAIAALPPPPPATPPAPRLPPPAAVTPALTPATPTTTTAAPAKAATSAPAPQPAATPKSAAATTKKVAAPTAAAKKTAPAQKAATKKTATAKPAAKKKATAKPAAKKKAAAKPAAKKKAR